MDFLTEEMRKRIRFYEGLQQCIYYLEVIKELSSETPEEYFNRVFSGRYLEFFQEIF